MEITLIAMPKRPYALMVSTKQDLPELPEKGAEINIKELDHFVKVHAVKPENRVEFIVEAHEVAFLRRRGWQNYDRYD
ncbi:MAG: hypothetical protein AAB892_00375 [Patescibacteria group bacterium]